MVSSTAYIGLSIGVLLSALLSIAFLETIGWRAILIGTLICILLVPIALVWLPESMSILVKKGRKDSIRTIVLQVDPKFVPADDDTYVLNEAPVSKVPLKRLFQGAYARNTLLLGTASHCLQMVAVTLMTWVTHLMVQRGFTLATGITFLLVFSASNLISTPLAGWMADRLGYKKVFALYMPILFVSISLIGVVQDPIAAFMCMFFAGFAALGSICLMLPYAGSLYPMSFRSTAMGVIYAIGRVGPILGPAIAGAMLAAELSVPSILVCIAAPSVVALVAFLCVKDAPQQMGADGATSLASCRLHVVPVQER